MAGFRSNLTKKPSTGAQLERVPRVPRHPLRLDNGCQAPVLRTAISLKNCGFRENHEKQVTYSAFANFWHPSYSESNCASDSLGLYPQTKARFGVSKKVLKVLVAQRASELQHLKIFGGIFLL